MNAFQIAQLNILKERVAVKVALIIVKSAQEVFLMIVHSAKILFIEIMFPKYVILHVHLTTFKMIN